MWTIHITLQAYRNRFHGRLSVRHVVGFFVAIASETGPNFRKFVIPSAAAYFVDFCDDAPGAQYMNVCISNGDGGGLA